MLTVSEAAQRVGKDTTTLYLAIRRGELKAERRYGLWLISASEIGHYKPRPRGRPRGLTPRNARLRTDISQSELARQHGVSRQCIHQVFNREAHNARVQVHLALKSGKLKKPEVCERCGSGKRKLEAHHPDYFKPLDVLWLCPPCHSLIHPHRNNIRARKI